MPKRLPRCVSTTRAWATCSSSTTRSPAAPTSPTSRSCRGRASGTRCRGRTTPMSARAEPASLPASSTDIYQEGLVVPPVRLTDEVLTIMFANMRNPTSGGGTTRAARSPPAGRDRLAELVERRGLDRVEAAMTELFEYSRGACGRRSCHCRTAATKRPTRSKAGRRAGRAGRVTVAGTDRHRLRRNCVAVRRQPQLPARRDALGRLLRRALSHRPGRAGLGRRLRTRPRAGAGRVARECPPAGRRRRRERRDLQPDRRRSLPCLRPGRRGARAGPGDDEQPRVRQRALLVLRDDRRRPGRMPNGDGPRPCTLRCRTRSTRRSRRSSSRTRSGWSVTRSASGPGGRGGSGAADGVIGNHRARGVPGSRTQRAARAGTGRARGGEPGAPGRNLVDGDPVPGKVTLSLDAGESVTIETPGGGGFGSAA